MSRSRLIKTTWLFKIAMLVLCLGVQSPQCYAQKKKVACVGNSVTFGYGIDEPGKNSYPAQLQALLGDSYEVGNFGKSGATLLRKGHRPYMQQEEFEQAVAFQPDIVIVSLGLNDTDPRNWPNYRDEFIEDYGALLKSFENADGSMPEIWLGRMTPIFHAHPRFKSGTRDWFWQIQKAIEQVAFNWDAQLIDWHTPLHARPDLFPDALHPTKEGATIMAQLAYQHLTGDFGGLQVAELFSDHMVLQRDTLISVWGTANRSEPVSVDLNGVKVVTHAGFNGQWRLELPAMPAGGPYQLTIASRSEIIVINDVLVGDVWLCAGQSNMAFSVKQSASGQQALAQKKYGAIRLLHFQPLAPTDQVVWDTTILQRVNRLEYLSGNWKLANSEYVSDFSAIGWYFGTKLERELNIPIGVIQMAVGGSPTEAWVDRQTLEHHPQLVDMLYNWHNNDHTMQWCRQRAALNTQRAASSHQRHPYQPAYLYEAGVKKIEGMAIKGVVWYQGESNAHNVELHEVLFPTMIRAWRAAFKQPDLPVVFAQLSSLNRPTWPHFRNSQRVMARQLPRVSMVVTSDYGNETDVHPIHKYPVAERLAYAALRDVYGKSSVPYGYVDIENVKLHSSNVEIVFSHTKKLQTSDGNRVRELELAGQDGIFLPVDGVINNNSLLIKTDPQNVQAIRYGWQPYSQANLTNEDGIPVSTFRVDAPFNLKTK
ncbi:GDSL-type esterase/lipase family protein [Carboxylicivirga taeanensis]|uniref:GDSL-type esterase/lipase family protein n=1 Tax=Carboxylicivirga taeanensis TaxID=1416875 RepID=UPI003F6DDBE9